MKTLELLWPTIFFGSILFVLFLVKRRRDKSVTQFVDVTPPSPAFDLLEPVKVDINQEMSNEFKKYFDTLHTALNSAKNRIDVIDYIEHGAVMNTIGNTANLNLESYYVQYYDQIEHVIRSKNIEYCRFLCLPINKYRTEIILNWSHENLEKIFEICPELEYVYEPVLAHIRKMKDYPKFKLYLIMDSPRAFSSMMIDETLYLKEHDKWQKAKARPDLLEVETISDRRGKVIIQSEIETILELKEKYLPLNVNQFVSTVPQLFHD